jgi:hypothetical protein
MIPCIYLHWLTLPSHSLVRQVAAREEAQEARSEAHKVPNGACKRGMQEAGRHRR